MADVKTKRVLNGVDVDALSRVIGKMEARPELGKFEFRARNRWIGGARNRSEIKWFYGLGKEDDSREKPFVYDNDEPVPLVGGDEAANPVEFVLHGLAGCLTTTLAYHAAANGIRIENIESELEGDLDLRGFAGVSEDVPKGFQAIRVTMRVKSKAAAERLRELAEYSAVFDTLRRPIPVEVNVVVDQS